MRKVIHKQINARLIAAAFIVLVCLFVAGCSNPYYALIEKLTEKDEKVRADAKQTLVTTTDTRAIQPLIVALKHRDPEVRKIAAEALGNKAGEQALEPLIAVALNDRDIDVGQYAKSAIEDVLKAEAGSLLFRVGDLKDLGSLAVKLRDGRWDTDRVSQYLRGQFTGDTQRLLGAYDSSSTLSESLKRALIDELNQELMGPSLFNEQSFAQVGLTEETRRLITQNPQGKDLIRLNRLLLEEAYPHEIAKSRKVDGEQSARRLEMLQIEDRAIESLIAAMKDRGTRELAGPILVLIRDHRKEIHQELSPEVTFNVSVALLALQLSDHGVAQRQAAEMLGASRDPRAIGPLIAALKEDNFNPYTKSSVFGEALTAIINSTNLDPLLPLVNSENENLRTHAVHILGSVNDNSRAVPALIHALSDSSENVRREACYSLGKIGHPDSIAPLIRALSDSQLGVRASAAHALKEIPDSRSKVGLAEYWRKIVPEVAASYAKVLAASEWGSDDVLGDALERYGNKQMAEDFLNCGNGYLLGLAERWAAKHGFLINRRNTQGSGPQWNPR